MIEQDPDMQGDQEAIAEFEAEPKVSQDPVSGYWRIQLPDGSYEGGYASKEMAESYV